MDEREQNLTNQADPEGVTEMIEIPAEEISAEEIPAEDIQAEEIPAEEIPARDVQAEGISAEEIPAEGIPTDGIPAEESMDSFEKNTVYVKAEEDRETPLAAGPSSAENSVQEEEPQAQDPGTDPYRQDVGAAPYRQDIGAGSRRQETGADADWRERTSRTNDKSGKFEPERDGRNAADGRGVRYTSSYDHYRFETPADHGPAGAPDPRYSGGRKEPSSGKKKNLGWIIAGIAAGVLAAAILLFFGVRALLTSAVSTARNTPAAGVEAGQEPGAPAGPAADAEAPAKEPETAIGNQDRAADNPQTAGRADTETSERSGDMTVPEVVQMCLPSMVAITNTTVEEYRDYFGGTRTYENVSAGSGIIIGGTETELLIATNNHVIENSTDITVTFIDDSVCSGTIKGQASDEDLAIISVNLADISAETREQIAIVALGNSDELQVGETVVAIGNALGYGQSVSRGVVSAMNREVTVDGVTHTLIQTDASINPGNSGGALLNLRGELIGINEVKYVNTEVEGIGYAIPINLAEPILTNLGTRVQREKVSEENRAYIGIKCVGVNSEYVQYGYPAGVYVSEVTPGGPADQAGLRTGDIITAIDGVPVSTTDQLLDNLEYYAAGETIDFSVSRQGEQIGSFQTTKIPVTLGKRSESGLDDPAAGNGTAAPEENSGNEGRDDRGFPTMPE